ncbi:MAG TPA: glycoside hydrolase family 3 N-terminal domain-containing protein [Gaiellaceae bacterium]|nr:glycoside hydrolase family 3 N-terminal domain-containing protein [Gaiellaceae bacterium]
MLRGSVAALVVVAVAALAASAAGSRHAGPWPSGEVVMGTLTKPPTAAFLARVRGGEMGGVLLLGRWPSARVVARATAALQRAACVRGEPLLVAVDQEGGVVRRFAWAAPSVAPAEIDDPVVARQQAAAAADALRAVGVDVDFAPVVDTPGGARSFLGSRAFSRSAAANATLGAAFVDGLQSAGAAATAKHFPGLGEAGANTDDKAVVVRAAKWKLMRGLVPFRKAVDAGVKLVMVGSAAYPALDPSGLPAVFSKAIETDLLRGELGFDGVAVTDALDAPAAARVPHAATKAIAAGADLLVFGSERDGEQAFATLAADARKYPRLRARLAESGQRIRELKDWLAAQGGPSCSGA